MKTGREVAVFAFAVALCGGCNSTSPARTATLAEAGGISTIAPSASTSGPEVQPTSKPNVLPSGSTAPAPPGDDVTQTSTHVATLVKQVAAGEAIGWDPEARTIVFRNCWREEGGGEGCVVKFRTLGVKLEDEILVYGVGEADDEAQQAAKRREAEPRLLERMRQGKYRALAKLDWPEGAASVTADGPGITLAWKNHTLSATGNSLPRPIVVRVKSAQPWKPRPVAVFSAADEAVLVVEVLHDPGAAYLEGANINSTFEVVELAKK